MTENSRKTLDSRFPHLACYIEVENEEGSCTGTGFLYRRLGEVLPLQQPLQPGEEDNGLRWTEHHGDYIVTNRHVIFGLSENEFFPSDVSVNVRDIEKDTQSPTWHEYYFGKEEIKKKIFVHENPDVDIAIIELTSKGSAECRSAEPITNKDLIDNQSDIRVECSDDILVVGYPGGFYDCHNLLPIVKQGIVASSWKENWGGEPYFLIDANLFGGSSGSAVITKPADHLFRDGKIAAHSTDGKLFALLGIYSGEPYIGEDDDPETIGVGIVWYSHLIEPIIEKKVNWNSSIRPSVSIQSTVRPKRKKISSTS